MRQQCNIGNIPYDMDVSMVVDGKEIPFEREKGTDTFISTEGFDLDSGKPIEIRVTHRNKKTVTICNGIKLHNDWLLPFTSAKPPYKATPLHNAAG